ncbi:tetratricopeptide repeat protein [Legionella fairfieldensis]|uniref:tetratricopeptide repeat protein n=1 Tax=Legionella fairfieldensis TaxID=45064 RepID=UPI00048B2159|nr:tetratricopeptide repeat protein [Legionella fairfieldensis]
MLNWNEMTQAATWKVIPLNHEDSLRNHQREILFEAINAYLQWRKNKNAPDDRGFPHGKLTWLRHFTLFGETRATHLKEMLSTSLSSDPIVILQNHFKKNSRVNNHSLDTYLLESILKNRNLFLIPDGSIGKMNTLKERAILRQLILEQTIYQEGEFVFRVAKLYETDYTDTDEKAYLSRAVSYYAGAIRAGYEPAYEALREYAQAEFSEAQYLLGIQYHDCRGQIQEAIDWCMKAAEQNHSKAIAYLHETQFPVEYYLMMARKYDQGDEVLQNISSAVFFYEKAYALKNSEAAFRLGQLYQSNLERNSLISDSDKNKKLKKNAYKAFNYYLIAAQQNDKAALVAMEKITEDTNDDKLRFVLGQVYLDNCSSPLPALTCFKQLADKNNNEGRSELIKLIRSNPDYAYLTGKLYEEDCTINDHLDRAFFYYSVAMKADHRATRIVLEKLANAGNIDAQFILECEFYHAQGQFSEAINWCIAAAEQHYPKAIAYLFNTQFEAKHYLMIAKKYDRGEGVTKNIESAMFFYIKACALNNREAAFRLGQLYQPNFERGIHEVQKEAYKAFHYYSIAAKQNDKAALAAMVEIAEHVDDDQFQFDLSQIYLDVFANPLPAFTHLKRLADKNLTEAKIRIEQLARSNSNYAYLIGMLYEEDVNTENHLQKAGFYYALGIQLSHDTSFKQSANKRWNTLVNGKNISRDELTTLGLMYYNGSDGLLADYQKAKQCFDKACEKGCETAAYTLGLMFQHAQGVAKNLVTALRYFQLAEDKHFFLATYQINNLLNSTVTTLEELRSMALMYWQGCDRITPNPLRALLFYQKASDRGDPIAAFNLGDFYQIDHENIQANATLAFHAYLQAAKLGNHDALIPLERLGDEVSAENQRALSQLYGSFFHNREKALYWHTKAIEIEQPTLKM